MQDDGLVTALLADVRQGDDEAMHQLLPVVYDRLRHIARGQRIRWENNETLNTTALVHEAYLKLVKQDEAAWDDREHFFAVAAKAMRHILVDYARAKQAAKRGRGEVPASLDDVVVLSEERTDTLLALDEALHRLAEANERQSQIVECRIFGGMSLAETAAVLDVSVPTVSRDWKLAQVWLYRAMQPE